MAVQIENLSLTSLTLPAPLRGVLRGRQRIVLNLTPAHVFAVFGGERSLSGVKITEVPDSPQYDSFFSGNGRLSWRATVAFGVAGAPTLVDLTDEGGGVQRDTNGHFTLTFPASDLVFLESAQLWAFPSPGFNSGHVHPHEISVGQATFHTEINDTPDVDPPEGSRLYVSLVLVNSPTYFPGAGATQ